jgi:N-acetylglucosamine-6-sulfatase
VPLAQGKEIPWRDSLLYEYYWERNFPQTPAMHALRTDKYKYIHYYGIWDTDELYSLEDDPKETKNLVRSPAHKQVLNKLNDQLFATLKSTDGMYIPLQPDRGGINNLRRADGSTAADFPAWMRRELPGTKSTAVPGKSERFREPKSNKK